MNKLYIAKPYDGTENLYDVEHHFLDKLNERTPRHTYISANVSPMVELIAQGFAQYLREKLIKADLVYPLDIYVKSLEEIDYTIPIFFPFIKISPMKSILKFEKIILTDNFAVKDFIKKYDLTHLKNRFATLSEDAPIGKNNIDLSNKFFILNETNFKRDMSITKHSSSGRASLFNDYHLADKLIEAINTNDFSGLEYKSL